MYLKGHEELNFGEEITQKLNEIRESCIDCENKLNTNRKTFDALEESIIKNQMGLKQLSLQMDSLRKKLKEAREILKPNAPSMH